MSPSSRQRAIRARPLPTVPCVVQTYNAANKPANTPPPAQHSFSPPNIHAHINSMNPTISYPHPINRIAAPHFLKQHTMEENWQMVEELMAEIERADYTQAMSQQPPVPGMSGVAYAGTPHSQTAAPSPLINSVQASPAPP
ncbi:hypothetical protein AZE42_11440, partial [Rhizopogon vesiculosus]